MITIDNMKPRFARIIVEPMDLPDDELSSGGIVLPDNAEKDKPLFGKVIAVGEGRWIRREDGLETLMPLDTEAGCYVTFGKYAGSKFRLGDKYYLSMEEAEIICEVDWIAPIPVDAPAPAQ